MPIEEVVEIICNDCLINTACSETCEKYLEVFGPVYKQMKTIEKKIGRRLSPDEVKQLAADNAKRIKEDESKK